MPDKDGKLTAEDIEKVKSWLGKFPKSADSPCPICGSTKWIIAENLVQPVTIGSQMSLQLGGLGYPQVMLISNPCGHTRFINAVMVGLAPPAPSVEVPKKD